MTLDYGFYGIFRFLIMGNAGFMSTVASPYLTILNPKTCQATHTLTINLNIFNTKVKLNMPCGYLAFAFAG